MLTRGFRFTISIRVIFLLWRSPPLIHLVLCTRELTNCFFFGVILNLVPLFYIFFCKNGKRNFHCNLHWYWYLDCVFGTVQLKNIWIIILLGQAISACRRIFKYSTVQCFASRNVIYQYAAHTVHLEYLYLLFRKQIWNKCCLRTNGDKTNLICS